MKNRNYIPYLIFVSILFCSCQEEKYEVLTEEDVQGLSQGHELLDLAERAAMHDGSGDDEFDQSSCFSINFPYHIEVSGTEIKVASASDLRAILERMKDLGLEEFRYLFPITLTMGNYEVINIGNLQELQALQEACYMEITDDTGPITCAQIDFPIRVFVYNFNTQETSSATFSNKQQLYVFLTNRKSQEVLNFEYPISLTFSGSAKVTVDTALEFQKALEMCKN